MIINVPEKPLHEGQKKARLLCKNFRARLYICGRRWGKTTEIRNLALLVIRRGWRIGLFCPQFKDISETWQNVAKVFSEVNNALKTYGQKPKYHIDHSKQLVYELSSKGIDESPCFECWSLANERKKDEGRGRKYNMVIYEEAQKIDSDVLEHHHQKVAKALLLDYKGSICYFFLTPPNSKQHYAYELICRGAHNNPNMRNNTDISKPKMQDPDMIAYRAQTSENPNIPLEELLKIKQTTPPLVFQQEYEALCVEFAGRMFFEVLSNPLIGDKVFRYKHIPFNPSQSIYLGIDFNKSPMAVTISQSNDPSSYWATIKEISFDVGERGTLYDICALVRDWFAKQGVYLVQNGRSVLAQTFWVTGDATGNISNIDNASNLSYYQIILKELGLSNKNLRVPTANPRHSERHAQANHLLMNHPNFYIAKDSCPRLVSDLYNTLCTADKGIDKKAYDPHFADAEGYKWNMFIPKPKS